jgi:hypothetical protein
MICDDLEDDGGLIGEHAPDERYRGEQKQGLECPARIPAFARKCQDEREQVDRER